MAMKPITAFLAVFEQKLNKLKSSIKDEIQKPKKERSKKKLKRFLQEAKELKLLIREMNPDNPFDYKKCPHCGEKLYV